MIFDEVSITLIHEEKRHLTNDSNANLIKALKEKKNRDRKDNNNRNENENINTRNSNNSFNNSFSEQQVFREVCMQ